MVCSREPGLGLELISEVHSAIARALKNPESFTRVRRSPTVRRVLTRRFPYRIFFIVRPEAIVVFAARHDRVWKYRSDKSSIRANVRVFSFIGDMTPKGFIALRKIGAKQVREVALD